MASDRAPRILMGSSSEGLEIARRLAELLSPDVEAQLWNEDFFPAGEFTLETLVEHSRSFDGALVVGTADDTVLSRGESLASVRDNLLVEFGLFVATFGRRRALLALEDLGEIRVPSDLFGLTCIGFSRTDPLDEGLGPAVEAIKRSALALPQELVPSEVAGRLEAVLRAFIGELQAAMGVSAGIGLHVWVVDERVDPPLLVRVARTRTAPKSPVWKEFEMGTGIVGECWRTSAAIQVDFDEEPYRSIDESSWKDFGQGARKGMDFEILRHSRERYRLVGAAPMTSNLANGLRFVGCLSYNVSPTAELLDLPTRSLAIEGVLERTTEVARIVIEGV